MARARIIGTLLVGSLVACAAPTEEESEVDQGAISGTPGAPAMAPSFPSDYESWPARKKQDFVWSWLASSEYCQTKGDPPSAERFKDYRACLSPLPTGDGVIWAAKTFLKTVPKLVLEQTFDRANSDEMPAGRTKLIHAFGSVAKIAFELDAEPAPSGPNTAEEYRRPYTGLFAPQQTVTGITRLSLAGPGFAPGIAVKLFVDGGASANFQAMFSIDGQEGKNFFTNALTNQVPPPRGLPGRALDMFFKAVKQDSMFLPVTALTRVAADGRAVSQPRGPRVISLVPPPSLTSAFASPQLGEPGEGDDFRARLRMIEPGSVLYDVYGSDGQETPIHIGKIKTASYLVASARGDSELFFRHTR